MLLAFLGPAANPASVAAVQALRAARAEGLLDDGNATAYAVSVDAADAQAGPRDAIPGLRVFLDHDGAVSRLYGLETAAEPSQPPGAIRYLPAAFLLDPLLRVIAVAPLARLAELEQTAG